MARMIEVLPDHLMRVDMVVAVKQEGRLIVVGFHDAVRGVEKVSHRFNSHGEAADWLSRLHSRLSVWA